MALDLFDDDIVGEILSLPHPVPRAWLSDRIQGLLDDEDCRIVLVTGEAGSGKSVLLARLAAGHDGSLRYFLRKDGYRPHRSGDAHSLLEAAGHQLASRHPDLFLKEDLTLRVLQSAERVEPTARVVGIRAEQIIASPFRRTALEIRQDLREVSGEVVGVQAERVVLDLRAMDWRDVQHLALLGPLEALAAVRPRTRVLLVVDALEESPAEGVLEWLAACPPLPSVLRIVVSARDGPYLGPLRLRQRGQLRELPLDTSADEATGDVAAYLRLALEEQDLSRVTGRQRSDLVRDFTAASDGNMQYATALSAGIQGALSRDDLATARALCEPGAVPSGLRPLYTFLVSRVREFVRPRAVPLGGGATVSAWNGLYAPALGTLAVARRPVSLAELAGLTGFAGPTRWLGEAVADMAQFIRHRDGGYHLHHRSLADFLIDPLTGREAPDCYLDPDEWHLEAGLRAGAAAAGEAPPALAEYGLEHACHHLLQLDAALPAEAGRLLVRLTTELPLIGDRIRAAGVDAVVAETAGAAAPAGPAAGTTAALARVLDRQRHALRGWDSGRRPA